LGSKRPLTSWDEGLSNYLSFTSSLIFKNRWFLQVA
jgi:hypothetical protein